MKSHSSIVKNKLNTLIRNMEKNAQAFVVNLNGILFEKASFLSPKQ